MPTILIVDDNAMNTKMTSVLLRRAGYDVQSAGDGPEALQMLTQVRPHLILMDIQLPGISGLEVTRTIKANPATAQIPIIALTAYAMTGDDQKAREAGCNGYMSKPIDHFAFLTAVKTWLAER
ncbi:MAG: response regulator [Ktedonobacterales bacterium]|nr:response regulator [Ktedonobacterales bacterium]